MSAKVTAKAVSQISEQFPSFISEEYPLYEKFVKNYYEFLETICVYYNVVTEYEDAYTFTLGETVTGQTSDATAIVKATGVKTETNKLFLEPTNTIDFIKDEIIVGATSGSRGTITKLVRNPVNALKLFSSLIDPNQTSTGVLEFFKKEFYPNIRSSSSTDLRKFIQNLKDFYRSRGSEKSFRTLFRILYGQENLDFYFPKNDMFKVSDGNWAQDTILQLSYDVSYLTFNGLSITGSITGTTAFVSNVTTRKLGTIPIIELVLKSINGTFSVGETITATTVAGDILSAIVTGQMTDVTINDGGSGYNIGDTLTITDSTLQGFGAVATVAKTTGDEVTDISSSNDGGNGYQVNDAFTFDNVGTNATMTAAAKVSEIKNSYVRDVVTTQVYLSLESITFDIQGDSATTETLPFNVDVQVGYLVANHATFASATKAAEIISITNSSLRVYDRQNEDSVTYTALANSDILYLFNDSGVAITGALSVTIDDASFTTNTSDIQINSSDYGSALNSATSSTSIENAMTIEELTFGQIDKVSITQHGDGYESVPSISIINSHYKNWYESDVEERGGLRGKNAAFSVGTLGGGITDIKGGTISESGFGYITNPTVTASTNTYSTGSVSADLSAVLTVARTKDGVFIDESGQPSSQKKIQDNDYYQDFSYVLKTTDSIDVWKQDVLKLLHPAGMKLFGEVAITTLLNSTMFDRGSNNINSILANGLSQYRELSLGLISEVLNSAFVTVETSMNKEVEIDLFLDNSIYYQNSGNNPYLYYENGTIIIMEDGDNLLAEIPNDVLNSQFVSIAQSIIKYLQTILSSNGLPAELFSLLSIKDVSFVNFGASETKILTSEPHYFHENDEIYLDGFEGTNVHLLNKKLFRVTNVDIENSAILINSTDGTADAGDNLLLETDGIILNEDIAIFTLNDPESLTDYGTLSITDDEVPLSADSVSITTNGQVYRPSRTVSSGLPINLLGKEYIGEYSDYEIDPYIYHYHTDDLSSLTPDTVLEFDPYNIIIDQDGLLLEDGDEILLEDSLSPSHGSYSGTSSNLGKLIEEEIVMISEDTGGRIVLSEAERKVVLGSYLKDETTAGEDNIVLEDEDNIMLEESGVNAGVLTFDQPFDYVRQPGNNGFGYFKHRVDQRVSV